MRLIDMVRVVIGGIAIMIGCVLLAVAPLLLSYREFGAVGLSCAVVGFMVLSTSTRARD